MATESTSTPSNKPALFFYGFAGALPWLMFAAGLIWSGRQTGSENPGMLYYFLGAGMMGMANIIGGAILLARGRAKKLATIFLWTAMAMGGLFPVGYLLVLILQVY